MRRLLVLAYNFPPVGVSGVQHAVACEPAMGAEPAPVPRFDRVRAPCVAGPRTVLALSAGTCRYVAAREVARDLRPARGETWRGRARRTVQAAVNPSRKRSGLS